MDSSLKELYEATQELLEEARTGRHVDRYGNDCGLHERIERRVEDALADCRVKLDAAS